MLGTVGPAGGFSKNGPQAPGGPTMPVPVTRAELTRWRAGPRGLVTGTARACRRASLSLRLQPATRTLTAAIVSQTGWDTLSATNRMVDTDTFKFHSYRDSD